MPSAHRRLALLLAAFLSAAAAAQTTDVEVELDEFGTGAAYRPGDFVGIRLVLTSNLDEAVQAWVQVEIPNADGDIAEYGRTISLNRGAPRPLWLYAPLPPETDASSVWSVRVFEMRDGRRRQELGGTRISPRNSAYVESGASMIGVVGRQRMRLDDLGVIGPRSQVPVAAHEVTRVVSGLNPSTLPDHWEGLKTFDAIAWSDAEPSELREPSARAIVEYVRRGGHLIIVLEEAGNRWGLGDPGRIQLDLEQLLPRRQPVKHDGVLLSKLLPEMSKSRGAVEDYELSIHAFDDLPPDSPYEPLVKLQDGRVVSIQRLFGFGRITVIGINVASGRLNGTRLANGTDGLPQADAFWNRVLGRRADAPTTGEIRAIEDAKLFNVGSSTENDLGGGRLFADAISMTQQAGVGLFLAFVLFFAYWLVAGPGGYYVLKHFGQVQHAWLAFAAAAGLFTAIAWGVVSLIPTTEVTVRHLTFLDHIVRRPNDPRDDERAADPQMQRAVSWISVFLDDYRATEVGIVSDSDQRDLLASWTPPGLNLQTFPNVARYMVDVGKSEARFELPGRSTATQLYANWLGAVERDDFGRLIQVDPDDPIRVVTDASGTEIGLTGTLVNDLPDTLTNVKIIWVKNNRLPPRRYARSGAQEQAWVARSYSGQMLNTGQFWAQSTWEPGAELILEALAGGSVRLADNLTKRYIDPYVASDFVPTAATSLTSEDRIRYVEMLSLFQQLTPPTYLKLRENDPDESVVRFYRRLGRELDLSGWFNRPCLIILGRLRDSKIPIPLEVGGEAVESSGTTIVRWVYPLPLDQRVAFPRPEPDA